MRPSVAALVLMALSAAPAGLLAVTATTEEAKPGQHEDEIAIRALIRKQDEGGAVGRTRNFVFSSGATPRPLLGRALQAFEKGRGEKMRASRPNAATRTIVRRIVVAGSRDLAYEFSDFRTEWDDAGGARTGLSGSILRVWKKVGGEWMQEALFAKPNQQ